MKRKYKALRSFDLDGRPLKKDATVELHPRQAKHFLGTHLKAVDGKPAGGKSAPKKGGKK